MVAQVSPGIVINEFDFSQFAERISTATIGMVGGASKGPVNTLTTITSEMQLIETFGKPLTGAAAQYLVHAGIQYLRFGNQLRIVRTSSVNGTTTVSASVNLTEASANTVRLTAITPGTWGNNLSVTVEAGTASGTFRLRILDEGIEREVHDNLKQGSANASDVDFVTTRIAGTSTLVTATDEVASSNNPETTNSPVSFLNGDDGLTGAPSLVASDLIGTVASSIRTGLKIFDDPDSVDINLLAVPGANDITADTSRSVAAEMIRICENRGDCLALIDPPFGLTVSGVRDFANAISAFSGTSFNSSYAALYWPWIKYTDSHNSAEVWTPPSGWIGGVMAFNDSVADAWAAPAGPNRGLLKSALGIEISPNLGERDQLYGPGQVVNPIVNFAREGITVWGQKTTQRQASSLNRVNVRRMLLTAEKVIATSVRFLIFEPNEAFTWRRFKGLVQPVLDNIKAKRGLTDFRVIMDESTNPPAQIDRNEMRGLILLKPTRTAEIITIDFTLLASGAKFEEFVS